MSEYTLADIKTGKVRSATFTNHGFSLDFFDQPGKNSHLTGTHLSNAEKHALVEYGVPCFHFEKNEPMNMPIIRGYDFEPLPWSSINRVTPEIGHSLLALAADYHHNFEPIKVPLALFTQATQEKLIEAATKAGRADMLVHLPIENSEKFYQQPDKYYREVISKIIPDNMKKLAEGIFDQREEVIKKLEFTKTNPNDLPELELFSAKRALEKQAEILNSHLSKINESVIIGKANDWNPQQTADHAKAAIKHLNAGIQKEIKTAKREANPLDVAKAECCRRIDNFIDKLFRAINESMSFTH
jgi:hypothetical protein